MATKALPPPPTILSTERFDVTELAPAALYRVSSYANGEPFFGRSGGNRFDAPGVLASHAEYGACYLGQSLMVALAESVLHDAEPVDGRYIVAPETLARRHVWRFAGPPLKLLDLSGALLKRLGGSAELAGGGNYALTQQWAHAVFRNPDCFDGFAYMSRHMNDEKAVILFDRAGDKLASGTSTLLLKTPGFAAAARKLGIHGGP